MYGIVDNNFLLAMPPPFVQRSNSLYGLLESEFVVFLRVVICNMQ